MARKKQGATDATAQQENDAEAQHKSKGSQQQEQDIQTQSKTMVKKTESQEAPVPKGLSDLVPINYDLLSWAESDEAQDMLSKVRGKARVESIKLNKLRPGSYVFEVRAATLNALRAARSLLELHLNFQDEYQKRKEKTERMEQDLRATNEEFENGLRVEFSVPENLIGLVIGKKGANVEKVKEETGVEKIVVDNKTRSVRIRGDDAESVKRARELLEYKELNLPVPSAHAKVVIGENGRNLQEIWRKSGCVNVSVEEHNTNVLRIVGIVHAVDLARELVETKIEFEQKMNQLNHGHSQVQKQLRKVDSDFREYGTGPFTGTSMHRRDSSSAIYSQQGNKAKGQQPTKQDLPKEQNQPPQQQQQQQQQQQHQQQQQQHQQQQQQQQRHRQGQKKREAKEKGQEQRQRPGQNKKEAKEKGQEQRQRPGQNKKEAKERPLEQPKQAQNKKDAKDKPQQQQKDKQQQQQQEQQQKRQTKEQKPKDQKSKEQPEKQQKSKQQQSKKNDIKRKDTNTDKAAGHDKKAKDKKAIKADKPSDNEDSSAPSDTAKQQQNVESNHAGSKNSTKKGKQSKSKQANLTDDKLQESQKPSSSPKGSEQTSKPGAKHNRRKNSSTSANAESGESKQQERGQPTGPAKPARRKSSSATTSNDGKTDSENKQQQKKGGARSKGPVKLGANAPEAAEKQPKVQQSRKASSSNKKPLVASTNTTAVN